MTSQKQERYFVEVWDDLEHKGKPTKTLDKSEMVALIEHIRETMFLEDGKWNSEKDCGADEIAEILEHLNNYDLGPELPTRVFRIRAKSIEKACRLAVKLARKTKKFIKPYSKTSFRLHFRKIMSS